MISLCLRGLSRLADIGLRIPTCRFRRPPPRGAHCAATDSAEIITRPPTTDQNCISFKHWSRFLSNSRRTKTNVKEYRSWPILFAARGSYSVISELFLCLREIKLLDGFWGSLSVFRTIMESNFTVDGTSLSSYMSLESMCLISGEHVRYT